MKKSIKHLSFLIATFLTINSFVAQQAIAISQGAEISFDKSTHDYGQIEKSANGECVFVFTNTGNQPLKISNAKGSCGCTVPQWPREEIAPGSTGEIRVRYDTKRVGVINKSVTIQSNAMNSDNITRAKKDSDGKVIGGTSTIRIKGEVKAPKTNATPMKPAQGPVNSSE
ncbi:DUF1573 domain-containing protein [bacterium]|nr:DUF1573 domain-containing protein [bacterium]